MNINYDYYKTFFCVATHGSFTKAAEELFTEQPNVTRTIKALEEQLGTPLFVRSKRRVELTPEGDRLYRHVRIAVEHIRLGEEEIARNGALKSGTVSIGTSETALYGLVLPILKDFRERYPDVRLRVGNYSTKQAIAALQEGFVDFAVATTPIDDLERLSVHGLKRFREIALCGDAFVDLTHETVSLQTLLEYPVIGLGKNTKTYDFYCEQFAARGLVYRVDIEVATADQLVPMIASNLGIGFVPETFLFGHDSVLKLQLDAPLPERTICLVTKKDKPLSLAAKRLFDEIVAHTQI